MKFRFTTIISSVREDAGHGSHSNIFDEFLCVDGCNGDELPFVEYILMSHSFEL